MKNEHETHISQTLAHMTSLLQKETSCCEEQVVSAVLLALHIPTNQAGFDYLHSAIGAFRTDPTQMITKELYPAVASLYCGKVKVHQVERAIRTAIDQAWNKCDRQTWSIYFSYDSQRKPSNSEFISRIARLIDLWIGLHCKV